MFLVDRSPLGRSRNPLQAALVLLATFALASSLGALPVPERLPPRAEIPDAWVPLIFPATDASPVTVPFLAGGPSRADVGAANAGAGRAATKHLELCVGGTAGAYECDGIDLYEQMTTSQLGGGSGNDIWGWTDSTTDKEYVLMGLSTGIAFVDISDPGDPVLLGNLPTHTTSSTWRDMKVYNDHAFVVSEASGHGMQIFDLTELRNVVSPPVTFSNTAHYDDFGNAHNIVMNEDTGFAYAVGTGTCSGGLHMVDVSTPTSPVFAGCFSDDGYTHDAQCVLYQGPDTDYTGSEICLACNEDTVTLVDVTDKQNPVQISRNPYAGSAYTHQGWLTEDHAYFLVNDEIDESNFGHNTRTYIWDVRDLDSPVLMGFHQHDTTATDHNLYVRGQYVFEANYRAGLRILSLAQVAQASLTEVAFFDTEPGGGSGAWSVYPYFPSGTVVVSDIGRGLFVLRPNLCSAPAAPSTLTALPDGDHRIALDWDDTAPVGGSYIVYRRLGTCPGGPFDAGDYSIVAEGVTSSDWVDTTASGQLDYAYAVRSTEETGFCVSDASPCSTTSTTGSCTAPPIFDGLDSASSADTATCGIELAWSPASNPCGGVSLGGPTFSVYRDTAFDFVPSPANRIASGLVGTSYLDSGVESDQSYTYIVRATDPDNGSQESNLRHQTATAVGVPADGTFAAGAEPGDPLLLASTGAGRASSSTPEPTFSTLGRAPFRHLAWEASTERANSGDSSYHSGVGTNVCLSLKTPPLELTSGQSSSLSFYSVWDIEVEWDGGLLEITADGGNSWQPLDLVGGYPGQFRESSDGCGFDQGRPSFTGTQLTWGEVQADLSPWQGQTIQVRWLYSTDGAENGEGWYLDDIALAHVQVAGSCTPQVSDIFANGFESGDMDLWTDSTP